MIRIKIIALGLCIWLNCNAEICLSQINKPDTIVNSFFAKYSASPKGALDYIFSTNKWMKEAGKQIDDVKAKLENVISQMGNYYGYEFITKKSIGESFMLYTYIAKYDRQPLKFTFIFYLPAKQWILYNFKFDDKLDEEIQDAAKLDLIIQEEKKK